MALITFTVPGQPIPKARARTMKGYSFTPKRTRDHEKAITVEALKALGRRLPSKTALYAVEMEFHRLGQRRADGDNLEKCVWDALSGVIWVNDHQVRRWSGMVFYSAGEPRTEIQIEEYGLKPSVSAAAHLGSC